LRLLRESASRAITKQLHAYLLILHTQLLPKSEAGQAIAYILKNWLTLTRYLETAICPSTTTEPRVRCARHSCRTQQLDIPGRATAAENDGVLRSFVSSCELNKLGPFAWFRDVLTRIASHSIQKPDQLLPHVWAPQIK
jgi:transposase